MLRATGLDDEAIAKPMIAVVHTWSNVSPCNLGLRELAQHASDGVRAGGGTPIEFYTIAITVSGFLTAFLIGLVLLPLVWVGAVVLCILAAAACLGIPSGAATVWM